MSLFWVNVGLTSEIRIPLEILKLIQNVLCLYFLSKKKSVINLIDKLLKSKNNLN